MNAAPTAHSSGLPAAVWLVRHAQSEGNVADDAARDERADRLTLDVRDPDVDLSPWGARQAQALGRWLSAEPPAQRPTIVLTSPYVRATRSAEIAISTAGLQLPVIRDERLRERDLGMFDGYTGVGIRRKFPEEAERRQQLGKFYYRPPGGESWADVALRVRSLLASVSASYAGERLAIFTHQAVCMVFRFVLEDLSERQVLEIDASCQIANCAVTRYDEVGGRLQLMHFNEIGHLAELDEPVTKEPDAETVSS